MFGKKKNEKNEENTEETTITVKSEVTDIPDVTTDQEQAPMVLSFKEEKALKKSRYAEKCKLFDKSFVIKNKRTGMIVELKASSSIQAANFIGWKANHTVLIKQKDLKDEKEAQERIDNANVEIENKKENCPALQ